jgi:hypothetical protein
MSLRQTFTQSASYPSINYFSLKKKIVAVLQNVKELWILFRIFTTEGKFKEISGCLLKYKLHLYHIK